MIEHDISIFDAFSINVDKLEKKLKKIDEHCTKIKGDDRDTIKEYVKCLTKKEMSVMLIIQKKSILELGNMVNSLTTPSDNDDKDMMYR